MPHLPSFRPSGFVPATPVVATLLLVVGCAIPALATVRGPTGGGGSVVVEPVPASEAPRTFRRVVFTCIGPGLTVFADRPCGPLPVSRELKVRDGAAHVAGASASLRAAAPSASTRPAPAGDRPDDAVSPEDADARACERLEAAVQALDDRMRTGYSAREAARLWARWREAKSRLREADC